MEIDKILDWLGNKINALAKNIFNKTANDGESAPKQIKQNLDDFAKQTTQNFNQALAQIKGTTASQIQLSPALYARLDEVQKDVNTIIKAHLKERKTARELAQKLYEGL